MRLRYGRPDLAHHAHRFDLPDASIDAPLTVTFLGVSTLLVDDGASALMTDGFFSRPSLLRVVLGRIAPDSDRIAAALHRVGVDRLDAVLPVHSHYDHALDSAAVAARTGAALVGGTSTRWIGRGAGLPEERLVVAVPGQPLGIGGYDVTLIESHHCPPDRFPGEITAPVVPPARAGAYRCGEAWSIVIAHRATGRRLLVQGSAGFVPGALAGQRAEVAYLGIGQLGLLPRDYLESYWHETVRAVGAERVVLTHWDDFFAPLDRPLRATPYAGDDLDHTLEVLDGLADADGVRLHLPSPWQRVDPWSVSGR